MYVEKMIRGKRVWKSLLAGVAMLGAALAWAQAVGPDDVLAGWLGREFTVQTSTLNDHMPVGGKLTFIYDGTDNVVRVCTRTVVGQRSSWHADFTVPCGVTMTFTRGTRFCTEED